MRKHELLTEEEREQLIGIRSDRDGLARLYTFESPDLDLIRLRREDRNRLGAALQLALFRLWSASSAITAADNHRTRTMSGVAR